MHPQIRNIIDHHIHILDNGEVHMNLSSQERTPLGIILGKLYYNTVAMKCIDRNMRRGYPHNGGSHTFTFTGPIQDAIAALELFQDAMENFRLNDEEKRVLGELMYIAQEIRAMYSEWKGIRATIGI